MNINRMKADQIKRQMELQAAQHNQPLHAQHITMNCAYVDATADAITDAVQKEIGQEIEKQMKSGKVAIEVDKASVKTAKKAIDDLLAPLRNFFK